VVENFRNTFLQQLQTNSKGILRQNWT